MAWALLVFALGVRAFASGLLPPSAVPIVVACRIDINHASAAELQALPGIGPARAEAIVLERIRNGPFAGLPDLQRVHGVGPDLVGRLAEHVSFGEGPMTSGRR